MTTSATWTIFGARDTVFLDASAIVAILKREPGADVLLKLLAGSRTKPVCSPLSRFEAVVSLARAASGQHRASTAGRMGDARAAVDRLLADLGAGTIPITDDIGTGALLAAQTYGRAVGHPADLNFGDCFAYACAKDQGADLLYIGGDFALTDMA